MRKVLFLRKKIEGQNSMEELAHSLKSVISELTVIELPYPSTSIIGMMKNGLWARKHQGQINHIFSITEGYLSLFLSGKKIITVHDLYFQKISFLGRIAIRLFWLYLPSFFTNRYTCISKETYKKLISIIPWIKKKVAIIYNPVSEEFFQSYISPQNPVPVILHIGTAEHKNLDKVIKAIINIKCKLIIVGKLSNDQKTMLLKNNIDFYNVYDVSRKELIKLYQKSNIVSFPSSQEGFGMIVVEANAMKKPVIAGDIPVLHEIGRDAALFVDGTNANSIKKAFFYLLKVNNQTSLIDAGVVNAKRFKLKNIAEEYQKLYLGLI